MTNQHLIHLVKSIRVGIALPGVLCWIVVAGIGGCGQYPSGGRGASFAVRDSGGVAIADNRGTPPELGAAVDETSGQRLARGVDLTYIRSVVLLKNGGLAIAQNGDWQVGLVDTSSDVVTRIGRRGAGPGEFDHVTAMYRCIGDTLAVWQGTVGRLSLFDHRGHFVRNTMIMPSGVGIPWELIGVAEDCGTVAALKQEHMPRETEVNALPLTAFWYREADATVTQVATVPGLDAMRLDIGYAQLPFGNNPSYSTYESQLFVGAGLVPEVRRYDRQGRLAKVIRWSAEREPISDGDREQYEAMREKLIAQDGPTQWYGIRTLGEYPVRLKPLFSRLLVDGEGRLWVQKYPRNWAGWERMLGYGFLSEPAEWWVFGASGRLLGLAFTPAGLTVLDIRGRMLAGVARDVDDVEQVHLYPLSQRFLQLLESAPY